VYAVIEVAGKQFRVTKGQWILVDQPKAQTVSTRVLMVVDGGKITTDPAKLDKVTISTSVTGTVTEKAERVMKFRPKQGRTSKRTIGTRRKRIKVVIDDIKL
jgi:large subunit ribosomal protein L21